jgi:hypothetical protein
VPGAGGAALDDLQILLQLGHRALEAPGRLAAAEQP